MPNLNEFFKKETKTLPNNIEVIPGIKPCSKCEKNSENSFWDSSKFIIYWECPSGHYNEYKVNG